jgi:hypothetical protein
MAVRKTVDGFKDRITAISAFRLLAYIFTSPAFQNLTEASK